MKKKTNWIKDEALYNSLPELIINFAFKSRVDSCHRLLMRCVRHAMDSRTPSLHGNTATIITHNGHFGIEITSPMPASMKKMTYYPSIAATSNDILCCKCTCICGSQEDQQVVCVHNIPLLFLLTLLLFDHLAEHMLLELAACFNGDI